MFPFHRQSKTSMNIVSSARNAIKFRIGFAFFVKRVGAGDV